jgi:hypothetical protein
MQYVSICLNPRQKVRGRVESLPPPSYIAHQVKVYELTRVHVMSADERNLRKFFW